MSVLPNSASFASFFVVFAISLLLTILLGLNLPTLLAKMFHLTRGWSPRGLNLPKILAKLFHLTQGWSPGARLSLRKSSFSFKRPGWTKIDYIQGYVDILNPTIELESSLSRPGENWGDAAEESWPFLFFWYVFRRLPVLVLHHFLANEVNFPFYQWFLYQHRHHPAMDIYYHWVFFVRDFFRFILLPAWIVLGGAVVCYLVVQDVLGLLFIPILRPVLCRLLPVFTICFISCCVIVDFFWYDILRRPRD
jgi:hypothetical protein